MAQRDPENEVHTERTSPASIMLPTIVKLSRNSLSIMDVTSACNREYMEAAEAAGYDTLQDTEFGKALRPIFKDIT